MIIEKFLKNIRAVKSIVMMTIFSFDLRESFFSRIRYFIFSVIYVFNLNFFRPLIKYKFFIDRKYFRSENDLINLYNGLTTNEIFDEIAVSERKAGRLDVSTYYCDQLTRVGYVDLSREFKFTVSELEEFKLIATSTPAYDSQVPIASRRGRRMIDNSSQYFSLPVDIDLLTPYYINILKNPCIRNIVNEYLGSNSFLYAVNTMITTPSKNIHSVTDIHRDRDDIKFLAIFVYWTATEESNGSTFFVPGSHIDLSIDESQGHYIETIPGSVYAMDTFALHSGNKNVKDTRVVSWFRFGSRINAASFGNKNYLFEKQLNYLY